MKPSATLNELQSLQARLAALEARMREIPSRFSAPKNRANYHHVTQTAHGFTVGKVIRCDGMAWVASQADTAEHAQVGGIVVAVPHANAFVFAMPGGYLVGLSVTAGMNYLSASSAGDLTATAPTIAVAVIMADTTVSGVFMSGGGGGSSIDGEYLVGAGTPFAVGTILQPDLVTAAWSDVDEDAARVLGMVVSIAGGMTTIQLSGFVHHDLSTASWWGSVSQGRAYLNPSGGLTNTKPTDPDEFVVPVADVVDDVYGSKGIFLLGGAATASELSRPFPLALKWGGGGIDLTTSCTPNGMVILDSTGENLATNSNAAGHPGIPWQMDELTIEWAVAPTVIDTRKRLFAYDPVANEPEWYDLPDVLPTATIDYQVLAWNNGTAMWEPWSLLDAKGEILSHDGTNPIQVDASTPFSVLGVAGTPAAVPAPIVASADNQIFARISGTLQWLTAPGTAGHVLTYDGTTIAWAALPAGPPTVSVSDEGKVMWVNGSGVWTATRDPVLGVGALTATSTQGLLGVVISNDGDYAKISSAGIELFDRSVSNSVPLITINIGHASLTTTARALSVREIDVCDAGVAKKMLVLASAPY